MASAIAAVVLFGASTWAQDTTPEPPATVWHTTDADGAVSLKVHFFWAHGCPYCKKERAFLDGLIAQYSWLDIVDYEVSKNRDNVRLMVRLAKDTGGSTSVVPTLFVCNQMTVGFNSPEVTGEAIHTQMVDCYKRILRQGGEAALQAIADVEETLEDIDPIDLPLLGSLDPSVMSLPLLTVAIATVDAFNPCGLFVLLMLMSMMIRAKSRSHMIVIGASFAFTWASMYFLLMTAWLSLFEVVGDVGMITTGAGAMVIAMAAMNFKDYLGIKRGPSLSISAKKKAGLFSRMGKLVRMASHSSTPEGERAGAAAVLREYAPLIGGTMLLTLSAGGYALLCTTGFAMSYTRVLTLHGLPTLSYFLFLLLYVGIYMIPMSLIVVVFTVTLGSRKLKDTEGRALKLLAAIMLASLGTILMGAPDLLKNPLVVVAIMMISFVVTAIVMNAESMLRRRGEAVEPGDEDIVNSA